MKTRSACMAVRSHACVCVQGSASHVRTTTTTTSRNQLAAAGCLAGLAACMCMCVCACVHVHTHVWTGRYGRLQRRLGRVLGRQCGPERGMWNAMGCDGYKGSIQTNADSNIEQIGSMYLRRSIWTVGRKTAWRARSVGTKQGLWVQMILTERQS